MPCIWASINQSAKPNLLHSVLPRAHLLRPSQKNYKKGGKKRIMRTDPKKTEKYTTIQGGNNHAVEVADITTNTAQNPHNTDKNDVVKYIIGI